MAWLGRGQGGYVSSQAWMFATPEEVHGKHVMHDNTNWQTPPAPPPSQNFSTAMWDMSTSSESHSDDKAGLASVGKANLSLGQDHGDSKVARAGEPQKKSWAKTTKYLHSVQAVLNVQTQKPATRLKAPADVSAGRKGNEKKMMMSNQANTEKQWTTVPIVSVQTEQHCANNKDGEHTVSFQKNLVRTNRDLNHHPEKSTAPQYMADKVDISDYRLRPNHKNHNAHDPAADSVFAAAINNIAIWSHPPLISKSQLREIQSTSQKTISTDWCINEYRTILDLVKETVTTYRMQSASHYALHIHVRLSDTGHKVVSDARRSQLNITFENYSQEYQWLCKRYFRKDRPTPKIMVCTDRAPVSLQKSLIKHFPASEAPVSEVTLREYWNNNGKSFNWNGLPTELKENIIQFCIVTKPSCPDRFHDLRKLPLYIPTKVRSCELVDRLGQWKTLLRVSTQIRAITLRLCFTGSLIFDQGLCITSNSLDDFATRLSTLQEFSQIAEPNSVPLSPNDPARLLLENYRDTPKLYPELKRYATCLQGVRKLDILFDCVESYHFFKVTAGGFGEQGSPRNNITYDVFEKMPHLNEIVVRLPNNRNRDWVNKPHQPARALFHYTEPCPRVIFRILYERIAEGLAAYENVHVKNFLDEDEEGRFLGLRGAAIEALRNSTPPAPLKLTVEELQEIGMHDGGGIQLTKLEINQVRRERRDRSIREQQKKIDEMQDPRFQEEFVADTFYPIRCECDVPCQDQYEFYPDW